MLNFRENVNLITWHVHSGTFIINYHSRTKLHISLQYFLFFRTVYFYCDINFACHYLQFARP